MTKRIIKYRKNLNQKGFTLVELVIYIGLLSTFLLVLLEIFISILNLRAESETTSVINQDTRYIFTRMAYDIDRADLVNQPATLGETTNSLQLVISGVTYTYSLSTGNLILTVGEVSDQLNSNDTTIENLSFQKIGNLSGKPTIKTQITVQAKTVETIGNRNQTFATTLGLR
jgi:type II secretory pathway pseudopilin PulG